MNRFFTEEADAFIGQKVIEYNMASTDKERLTLESIVKERTGILLYLIPQRNLYIKEEDLSGYYLDVIKDIDRIIGSYAISGRSYIAYLTQICRYRCMRYIRKKEKAEQTEIAMLRSDPALYDYALLSEPLLPYTSESPSGMAMMDMKGIIRYILGACDGHESGNEEENILARHLESKVTRRRFLEYLMNLPQVEDARFLAGVSRVLRVDCSIIARFYELRRSELSDSHDAIESAEDIAARYWKLIATLRHAITKEADAEKLGELMEAVSKAERIYRKRLRIIRYAKRGLPHGRIAEIFSMPRSTVSNDISKIKHLLSSIKSGMDY